MMLAARFDFIRVRHLIFPLSRDIVAARNDSMTVILNVVKNLGRLADYKTTRSFGYRLRMTLRHSRDREGEEEVWRSAIDRET